MGGDRYVFIQCSFRDVIEKLKIYRLPDKYELILINGVFLYINDSEIENCLEIVKKLLDNNGIIYIKDAIGIESRLTLHDFKSTELKGNYSAIYRTLDYWEKRLNNIFPGNKYVITSQGPMWPQEMRNRSETEQYYWIINYKK